MVRLKDICSMTKEKTARLIPNAIQLCTDNEKVISSSEQLLTALFSSPIFFWNIIIYFRSTFLPHLVRGTGPTWWCSVSGRTLSWTRLATSSLKYRIVSLISKRILYVMSLFFPLSLLWVAVVSQRAVALCPSVLWEWAGLDEWWWGLCSSRWWL